jgi:undecaprenyl-diphosphatase
LSIWISLLLGLVQGATEFLPVSSSGHLAIISTLLDIEEMRGNMLFDVLLHLGTLGAVFAAFHKDIGDVCRAFFSLFSVKERNSEEGRPARRLILLLIVATLPLIAAVVFARYVSVLADNLYFVGCALLGTGALLYISDRIKTPGKKNEKTARVSDAVCVGLMQAVAVIPGLSRSGATITMGLMRGFDRKFAVKFSFLMSIPAVAGATLYELREAFEQGATMTEFWIFLPGMIAAGVVGYFAIALIKRLAAAGRFGVFAYYCAAVGMVAIGLALFYGGTP